jgi:hypothetical protein
MSTPTKEIIANTCITGDLVVSGSITGAFTTDITTTSTIDSTGATDNTGALQIDGGGAIAKKLYVGTELNVGGSLTANDVVLKNTTGGGGGVDFSISIGNSTTGGSLNDTTSLANVLVGNDVGPSIATGDNNVAIGNSALTSIVGTGNNIAIGSSVLTTSTGGNNIGIGSSALTAAENSLNIGIGTSAGAGITTGQQNVAIGHTTLNSITTGQRNTSVGYDSGGTLTTAATENTFFGNTADGIAGGDNQIAIGYMAAATASNECVIGNSSLARINPGANNSCDLGESGVAFKDLHLAGIATLGATTAATVSAAGIVNVPNTTETLDTASKNVTTAANGAINTKGDIQLYSSSGSCVRWSPAGVGAPSTSEHSIGSKLILLPKDNTVYDYAIGIEEHYVWISSPTGGLKVYGDGAQILQVNSSGVLSVNGLSVSSQPSNFFQMGGNQTLTTGATTEVGWDHSFSTTMAIGANAPTLSTTTVTNDTIDINEDGFYLISYTIMFDNDATGNRLAYFKPTIADSPYSQVSLHRFAANWHAPSPSINTGLTGSAPVLLADGDSFIVYVYQNSGGDLDLVDSTDGVETFLSVVKMY